MKYVVITTLLIAALCIAPAAAMTGSGTQADPYKIYNQADLALLSGANYAGYVGTGKYFELANDISMTGNFQPIGTLSYKFNGKFDGKGFTINGLTIDGTGTDCQGMFAYVTAGANIKNIVFDGASIKGESQVSVVYGQGVGATVANPVIVDNVIIRNSIVDSSGAVVGGVSGYGSVSGSVCIISNCQVLKSTIKSSGNYVGGVFGIGSYLGSAKCTIRNCIVDSCQVCSTSGNNVGGVSGFGSDSGSAFYEAIDCQVRNCIIQTPGAAVGGVSGYGSASGSARSEFVQCSVENCYIQGSSYVGGIAGYGTRAAETATCQINECIVDQCTVRATSTYAGGIYGSYRNNGAQPIVSGCDVSDSSILANSNAGGVTGGYSA